MEDCNRLRFTDEMKIKLLTDQYKWSLARLKCKISEHDIKILCGNYVYLPEGYDMFAHHTKPIYLFICQCRKCKRMFMLQYSYLNNHWYCWNYKKGKDTTKYYKPQAWGSPKVPNLHITTVVKKNKNDEYEICGFQWKYRDEQEYRFCYNVVVDRKETP